MEKEAEEEPELWTEKRTVSDRVQCLLGSQTEGAGTVVSPRRRHPKKETEAVAHTAAWKGFDRSRCE